MRTFLLAGIILLVLRGDERVAPLVEYVDACAEAIEPILHELHAISLPRIDETADPRASRVEHACLTLLLDPGAT